MDTTAGPLTPHTRRSWRAVWLGLGVPVVGLLLYFVSSAVTDGGTYAAPGWLLVLTPAAVLGVAVPAVVLGLRSRHADPSLLGTVAWVLAAVLGAWAALSAVVGLFL